MPKLTIDGKEITVDNGTTIFQSAQKLGIFIPHYCYHSALSIVGSCRMCLVEVEGNPKPVASCSTPVQEGMKVLTNSENVKKSREAILEFLLINHPLDCPICDQAGECLLQDYAFLYGRPHSRFKESKRVFPKKVLGDSVVLYTNRCILCTRCVRFLNEVAGYEELGVFERGITSQIDVFPDRPLKNKLAGNVVDICPVGALIDKDFLHKTRVWNLASYNSICSECSSGCNIRIDVKDNGIYRIKPRLNTEVNNFWICDYGRYDYHKWDDVSRIENPAKNKNGQTIKISWENAIELIDKNFKNIIEKYGSSAVAGIGNSSASNEENFLLYYYVNKCLKSENVFLYHINVNGYKEDFKCGFKISSDKNPNKQGAVLFLGLKERDGSFEILLDKIEKQEIRALYFIHKNIGDVINEDKIKILWKLDFLALQDVSDSNLTKIANVALPSTNFYESDGSYINSDNRIQRFFKAIEQPSFSKEGWEILSSIIKKFGEDLNVSSVSEVFNKSSEYFDEVKGLTFYKLGDSGVKLK